MESLLQWLASSQPAAWVQALGTPIIGVAAVYVAYQGATTARKKLKFDMFERRVRLYEDVRAFFRMTDTGALTFEEARTLSGPLAHAKFLFADPAIDAFLKELSQRSLELFYSPMPKRPSALRDSPQQLDTMADPDPIRKYRQRIMSHYQLSRVTDAAPPTVEKHDRAWFDAAAWITDNKGQWDKLTLSYLQLNH